MVLSSTIERSGGETAAAASISNTIERVLQRHAAWGQVTEPMFHAAPERRRSASAPAAPQSRDTPMWLRSDDDEAPAVERSGDEGSGEEGSGEEHGVAVSSGEESE